MPDVCSSFEMQTWQRCLEKDESTRSHENSIRLHGCLALRYEGKIDVGIWARQGTGSAREADDIYRMKRARETHVQLVLFFLVLSCLLRRIFAYLHSVAKLGMGGRRI